MLNASELRIGNLVFSDTEPSNPIVTILEILQGYANTSYKEYPADIAKNSILYNRLHPIPLTPEILVKCGFERDEEEDCNGYMAYRPDTAHYSMRMFINAKGHVCAHYLGTAISTSHPQSLHQLQNLTFALTGEELKIQL